MTIRRRLRTGARRAALHPLVPREGSCRTVGSGMLVLSLCSLFSQAACREATPPAGEQNAAVQSNQGELKGKPAPVPPHGRLGQR